MDADLAAMARFGKTIDELTEDEFVAFVKTGGSAQFVRVVTVVTTVDMTAVDDPPDDDTEDLTGKLPGTGNPSAISGEVGDNVSPTPNSKKPSTTSTAKHLVEGVQNHNQQEADPS